MASENRDFPFSLIVLRKVFNVFATRVRAWSCSLAILLGAYAYDSYQNEMIFLAGAGSMITIIGLILTIKNTYLTNIRDINYYIAVTSPVAECASDEPNAKDFARAITEAKDEGHGLVLIVLGTLINVFSPLFPLTS